MSKPLPAVIVSSHPGASFSQRRRAALQKLGARVSGCRLHITRTWLLAAKFDGEFALGSQTRADSGAPTFHAMSLTGPKPKCKGHQTMSAYQGEADMPQTARNVC
jgi:hypothetical protein